MKFAFIIIFIFSVLPVCFSAQAGKPVEEWNLTYGGRYGDGAWCLQETEDGGNILVGNSASEGKGSDLFLIRTDGLGNCIWSKTLGGSGEDVGYFVQETQDGGFIVTGSTKSFAMGEELLWLVKTDGNGSLLWDKTFGGFVSSSGDGGWSVDETDDGGYITAGYTQTLGSGRKDLWLIKTDGQGSRIWDKTFGGREDDVGMSVLQSRDGGYIAAGRTASFGKGGDDIWLLKTDFLGKELWNITFGGKQDDAGFQVVELADGYAVAGRTESGLDKKRIILIKADLNGQKLWERAYQGSSASSLQSTADGGFVIAGRVDNKKTGRDALIIKADSKGSEEWSMTLGGSADDIGTFAVQRRDGSYSLAGITSSQGSGREDAWLVKIRVEPLSDENKTQLQNSTLPNFASLNSTSSNSSSLNSSLLNSSSPKIVQFFPVGKEVNEATKADQIKAREISSDGVDSDINAYSRNFEEKKKLLKEEMYGGNDASNRKDI
ncbi:MAG: hypothetical protein LUO89_05960 [Methanothrix sp.]|nr:hypothetical protein [Methanothrix sp.]